MEKSPTNLKKYFLNGTVEMILKGVFAKNEREDRLNPFLLIDAKDRIKLALYIEFNSRSSHKLSYNHNIFREPSLYVTLYFQSFM